MKRLAIILIVLIFSISILASCSSPEPKRYEAQFLGLFDTVTQIVAYTESKSEFEDYVNTIHDELEIYNNLYDIYKDYEGINNLKTINDNAGIAPVEVDKKIIDLLLFARDAYEMTDGYVNVAFGSVLSIWHDYREKGTEDPDLAELPSYSLLFEAVEHTDIDAIVINEEESTVFLSDDGMKLDVGAIAKGFAIEKVAMKLYDLGFDSGLISVGGNVRAIGTKDNDIPWNLGIQNPDISSDQTNIHLVNLMDSSLVTSGDYIRYYTVDGKRYHHIIDPNTLYPAEQFKSVTIICRDSGLADMLSTALYMMPFEKGLALLDNIPGSHAVWIENDGNEKFSPGFESFLSD